MKTSVGIVYWFVAGALVGLGLILFYSVGLLLLLAGIAIALYSFKKVGVDHFWALLTGMGLVPAALLLFPYITALSCPPDGAVSVSASGKIVSCTSFAPGYLYVAAVFGALALIGIVWGLVKLLGRGKLAQSIKV